MPPNSSDIYLTLYWFNICYSFSFYLVSLETSLSLRSSFLSRSISCSPILLFYFLHNSSYLLRFSRYSCDSKSIFRIFSSISDFILFQSQIFYRDASWIICSIFCEVLDYFSCHFVFRVSASQAPSSFFSNSGITYSKTLTNTSQSFFKAFCYRNNSTYRAYNFEFLVLSTLFYFIFCLSCDLISKISSSFFTDYLLSVCSSSVVYVDGSQFWVYCFSVSPFYISILDFSNVYFICQIKFINCVDPYIRYHWNIQTWSR